MFTTDQRTARPALGWPLMRNNVTREDLDGLIDFLRQNDPVLTQSQQVRAFEEEWSRWLGVRHSVFVNSGSSANLVTLAALKALRGGGEVVVPTLTWVSDIAAVLHCGFEPVFVDIDPHTLGMDVGQILEKLSSRTRAVFLTHVLGYNGLSRRLLDELKRRDVPLIEDGCESHGATFQGRKLGTFGWASNFSFYYAHHLSTVEGGMVCTEDENVAETVRMLRSHGLVRDLRSQERKEEYWHGHPDLNPEFIFAYPAWNVRSTEMNAVLGRSQLKRLDDGIRARNRSLRLFLDHLDPDKYWTDFATEGCSNYALTLVLRHADPVLCRQVMRCLRRHGIEYRRGMSGGGNQLRQPYLAKIVAPGEWKKYPRVEHVHFYGFYIGNYPDLDPRQVVRLCRRLNRLPGRRLRRFDD
jgi:CDP-6-deoxy-D-xylo-4-hexulose-3-dehydrase